MNKKISIIVPVYNTAEYLAKCIESIINQKYANLELILVDDGSTDHSAAICDEYAKKDNRIKVIHKQNSGVSSARNLGLSIASGDYITFVDSDDYILDSFSNFCNKINNQDLVISCDEKIYERFSKKINRLKRKGRDDIISFLIKNSATMRVNVVWNKMFSQRAIQCVKFSEKVAVAEDMDFILQVLFQCKEVDFVPINYYFYYQRETSVMHENSYDGIVKVVESGRELINYYNQEFNESKWKKKIIVLISENVMCGVLARYKSSDQENKNKALNFIKQNVKLLSYVRAFDKKLFYIFMKVFGVKFALKVYCLLKNNNAIK